MKIAVLITILLLNWKIMGPGFEITANKFGHVQARSSSRFHQYDDSWNYKCWDFHISQ